MAVITVFDPWKNKLCACPEKYSFAVYTGCSHGCLYCYASSYIRNFFRAREKINVIKKLKKEIIKIPENSIIAMANSCDPYQPLEKKLELTRQSLSIMAQSHLKINLVTKSALILRDIDILKSMKNIVLSFTFTALDDNLAKKIEPFVGYTAKEKLNAVSILSKNIPVAARLDPLIYPLNTSNFKRIITELKNAGTKQIITSTYKVRPDSLMRMTKRFPQHSKLWNKLYIATGEKIGGYHYLPFDLRKKLIEEVKEIALSEGLGFSSCREGFATLNTSSCDGTSLFNGL